MIIGSTISHYKILEKLGEGGMGVVYKAEDTKLNRQVALKFLADHLLSDGEAKERFLREAQAAAALHHPNVCPVYEIDEVAGKTFLAMAFLKGETLEQLIARGPLPIKDALDIARQTAEGLQAAHAEAVVHRDIKPANILVSPEGRPTIMDFGLARLTEASRLTKVDTAMGTVAYMSPEQAQGMEVDHRSDVWSLGCVLYEMVSGQRPFLGQYDQALFYEIVHEQVAPLTSVRAGVPMELEFIVGKCLAKDREDRHQAAKEVAVDLRNLAEKLKSGRSTILRTTQMTGAVPALAGGQTVNPAQALPSDSVVVPRRRQQVLVGLLAMVTLVAVVLALLHFAATPDAPERAVARFSFTSAGASQTEISPDGKHILYVAGTRGRSTLWVRSLASESVRELAGTEGVLGAFWSPDSRIVGFGTSVELKRVSLDGGSPVTLARLPSIGGGFYGGNRFSGGTWSPDGQRIVFSAGYLLYEIAAVGGDPMLLFEREEEGRRYYSHPRFLPPNEGKQAITYTAAADGRDVMLAVMDFESGERRELVAGWQGFYAPVGFLLYAPADNDGGDLRALPFSIRSLSATGEPFPINAAGLWPSVSESGTLTFLDSSSASGARSLAWRDRQGSLIALVGQPQGYMNMPSLSPDGRRVAVRSRESGAQDIWVQDLVRSTKTRLTFNTRINVQPTWSPSGRDVLYESRATGKVTIESKPADGTGEAIILVESPSILANPAWSPDGRYVVYQNNNPEGVTDIHYLEAPPNGTTSEPVAFLDTPARERVPKVSPDGRFLAYLSDESGRDEVYVRPFPSGAGRWQAYVDGGTQPLWSPDGSELFFVDDGAMMTVPVSTQPTLTLGQPQLLFESEDLLGPYPSLTYDVSPDAQRFLTITPFRDENAPSPAIRIVLNWYEEFRNREQ